MCNKEIFMRLGKLKFTTGGLIGICISLALALTVDVSAETKIYKYVDENGVVSFTSKPPSEVTETEPVDIPEGNIIHKRKLTKKTRKFQNKDRNLSEKLDKRIDEFKKRADEIATARAEVKTRKENLEKGKVPSPGERVGTVTGHSRLRPSYHNRVKRLEAELAAAEKKLSELENKYKH